MPTDRSGAAGRPELSIVVPARDEAANIRRTLEHVLSETRDRPGVEILVVDGGSRDGTLEVCRRLGVEVLPVDRDAAEANPARLRNLGAARARGRRLVFLDADCAPTAGWLEALERAHAEGALVVGGAFDLPEGLPPTARCDYYAGWYHAHPGRPRGPVVSAPPGNLSVERSAFHATSGFDETPGIAYAHEELRWQAELAGSGIPIHFEPEAVVLHRNRPGLGNLLRRNYRWGYSALESKAATGAARFARAYRHPALLIAAALPLALPTALYVVAEWARNGRWEPLLWLPAILAARVAWGLGMMIGGSRWLLSGRRRTRD